MSGLANLGIRQCGLEVSDMFLGDKSLRMPAVHLGDGNTSSCGGLAEDVNGITRGNVNEHQGKYFV